MTRKQAQKLGPEVFGFWNNWEQFLMRDGILMRKWYTPVKDDYQEIIVVPQVAKRSVRRVIDKWIKNSKPCAARSTAGRHVKTELQPVTVGV